VSCRLEAAGAGGGEASFRLPQLPVEEGRGPEAAAITAALGLSARDVTNGRMRPSCWSAGMAFAIVPVGSLDAVRSCAPDAAALAAASGGRPVYVIAGETVEPGHAFHARMFAPGLGISEDPATGAAAAAFAGLLAAGGALADGEHSVSIEQGYEMARPSLIRLRLQLVGGRLKSASIAGAAVVVTEGMLAA
jgi:trans-2,3-dihydro-3-hydroxyanthranilate isomerase